MTTDPKIVEWMHARIDGVISEDDDRELSRHLEENPADREHFDQLRSVAERLNGIEQVAPPADLRRQVMDAVRALRATRDSTESSQFGTQRTGWTPMRYAYAVAAGIILGVVGYHWGVTRSVVDPAAASGAMTSRQVLVEQITLEFAAGTGSARIERAGDGFVVTIELESTDPVDVALDFGSGEIEFRGFSKDLGSIDSFQVTDSGINWTQNGHRRVAVSLDKPTDGPATLELFVSVVGGPTERTVLRIPGPS